MSSIVVLLFSKFMLFPIKKSRVGVSKGGKTTEIHLTTDKFGRPIRINLSADNMNNSIFFEKQIVTREVENAVIITASNEVYHCSGDKNNISSILELGDKLKGAYVTHNHPIGSVNDYTFSDDDIRLFENYKLAILRGVDEKFVYELNRNADDIEMKIKNMSELIKFNKGIFKNHRWRILKCW